MVCWGKQLSRDGRSIIIEKSDPHGSFSFAIELENLFGFCEDYDKVMFGMRHKLTIVRKGNDNAIFKVVATAKGKVELTKLAWVMHRFHPNGVKHFSLYKNIESKIVLDAAFRMRQCSIAEIPAQTRTFDWRLGVRTAPEKQDMF